VTLFQKVLVLLAGVPGLAAAADPEMLNLVMPGATMVMDVNLTHIMASPIGAAMKDAVHKGVTTQLKADLTKAKPQFQDQIAGLANIDWSQDVRDILVAGGPGKQPPVLVIVRTSLDQSHIQALMALTGNAEAYEGVPLLSSQKPGDGVIAFLDNSIVLLGQKKEVEAAIHRRAEHTPLSDTLAQQVKKYSGYDLWVASTEIPMPPPPAKNGPNPQQYLEKIAGINGGLKFGPDFDLSADVEARTEKAAAEMSEGMRWLTSMVQTQAKSSGKGTYGLDSFKYRLNGKHVLLSLHVPEAQVRAGIKQMQEAQAAQAARPAPAHPAQTAAMQAPPVSPTGALPSPPPGTIRVQSSEMGTVLIPVGN
jgi:hypothetical protein